MSAAYLAKVPRWGRGRLDASPAEAHVNEIWVPAFLPEVFRSLPSGPRHRTRPASNSSGTLSSSAAHCQCPPRPLVSPRRPVGHVGVLLRWRSCQEDVGCSVSGWTAGRLEGELVVDVGRTLWQYCHTLRHDGMDYGEYLDQLTYLLFLKMADERSLDLPLGTGWGELVASADDRLLSSYGRMLARLKESDGLVGDIFSASASAFSHAESLRRVIRLLDQVKWASLPSDVQADAFEYLLEQAAAEGKKGAGQYFTPRALIESIVACMRPGALATDRLVSDPAAGTGGFLVAAHMWAETNVMIANL